MFDLLNTGVTRFNFALVIVVTAFLLALWLHFRRRIPEGSFVGSLIVLE